MKTEKLTAAATAERDWGNVFLAASMGLTPDKKSNETEQQNKVDTVSKAPQRTNPVRPTKLHPIEIIL